MKIQGGSIVFDNGFVISLHRTVRLPEDGKSHSLPPSFGQFPMKRIEDYRNRVPREWRDHGGVFIPMYEREAMWLGFSGSTSAVKIATGKINAVSGGKWTQELQPPTGVDGKDPEQDYMVGPHPQPWLDGFNIGGGQIRQFVAMQMGKGYTVEGQVTGKEDVGGIQVLVIPPKPGAIKVHSSVRSDSLYTLASDVGASHSKGTLESIGVTKSYATTNSTTRSTTAFDHPKGAQMGLAQGGRMEQKISVDPHGIDAWDQSKAERIFIHIVDAALWKEITGEECPSSPIPASKYKGAYFTYDNGKPSVQGSGTLANVKPVSQKDKEHSFTGQQDDSLLDETKTNPIVALGTSNIIKDGKW
jgi:hypothetical protein